MRPMSERTMESSVGPPPGNTAMSGEPGPPLLSNMTSPDWQFMPPARRRPPEDEA